MKFAGITRIRNEENVIKNTLDYLQGFVDEVYVYDDCSTDNTVDVCKQHPLVVKVIEGKTWASTPEGRRKAEGELRQRVYREAYKNGADFVYYFDADEYIEPIGIDFTKDVYFLRLFDFYITEEDVDKNYLERKWMGPEYRDIPMIFRTSDSLRFTQRVPRSSNKFTDAVFGGYVKHYGKAMSVEEWETTCDFYINVRWKGIQPHLQERWMKRKGKAIHTLSDFERPLITWEERKDKNKIVKII